MTKMFNYINFPEIYELFKEDIDAIINEKIKDDDKNNILLLKECVGTSDFLENVSEMIDFDFNKFIDKKIENDTYLYLLINKILIKSSTAAFMAYSKNNSERSKKSLNFQSDINRSVRNFKNLNEEEKERIIKLFKKDLEAYNKIGLSLISMQDINPEELRSEKLESYRIINNFINQYVLKEI